MVCQINYFNNFCPPPPPLPRYQMPIMSCNPFWGPRPYFNSGIEKATYALSNINAILGSGLTLQKRVQDGEELAPALTEFGLNVLEGGFRNAWAHDIYRNTGSSLGHMANSIAGYGNPYSNYAGTRGLFNATLYSSMMMPTPFGCGLFGGLGFYC